jgi:hypothetical protein
MEEKHQLAKYRRLHRPRLLQSRLSQAGSWSSPRRPIMHCKKMACMPQSYRYNMSKQNTDGLTTGPNGMNVTNWQDYSIMHKYCKWLLDPNYTRLFGGRDDGLWEWPDLSYHSLVGSFKIEFFFFLLDPNYILMDFVNFCGHSTMILQRLGLLFLLFWYFSKTAHHLLESVPQHSVRFSYYFWISLN